VFEYNAANDCYRTSSFLTDNHATNAAAAETSLSNGGGAASISSTIVTQGTEVLAFTFKATDAGADGAATHISQMMIKPGSGNFFGNFQQLLQGADLFDDVGNSLPAVVNSGDITIGSIPNGTGQLGEVPNGGNKVYTLKVYLNAPLNIAIRATADQKTLVLSLAPADVITTGATSTMTGSAQDSGSGNGVIDVTATKLVITTDATNTLLGQPMTPVVMEARDGNNALDLGFVSTGLISTGTLQTSPTTTTFSAGIGTFSNVIHTATGAGLTMTSNSGITNPTTAAFNITRSTASDVIATAGYSYPQNIDFAQYQENTNITAVSGTSIEIAKFDVRDGGGSADGDGAGTTLTSITFTLANASYFRRLAIYDAAGVTELGEVAVVGSTATFPLSITAPDNNSISFTVRASFKTVVTDKTSISLTVTSASAPTTTSSGFINGTAGGAVTSTASNNNKLNAIATRITFVQQPSNTAVTNTMTPSPSVQAIDPFGNLDIDETSSVDMLSTGVLSSSPQTALFGSGGPGIAVYPGIVHSTSNNSVQLFTNHGTLANVFSNVFQVLAKSSAVIENAAFIYPFSIAYNSFQENTNIVNSATSLVVAKFDVRDGLFLVGDPDNAPTTLNSITLDLGSNYTFIRRIALYDASGTTEIPGTEQVVSSQLIAFSGFNITALDNSSTSFTVRVSFTTAVVDKQYFDFTVNAVTAVTGFSDFALANGSGAVTSTGGTNNMIEVTASELRFLQQPTNALLRVSMLPAVTVRATDNLGTIDLDNASTVSLLSSGVLQTAQSKTFAGGLGTYGTVSHTQTGIGLQLTTSNVDGLTNAASALFNITASATSDIITTAGFTYTSNIHYEDNSIGNQENVNLISTTGTLVAAFDIRDGGASSPDADNAPTTINSITFDLGPNWTFFRRIALWDGTGASEWPGSEKPVTSQIIVIAGAAPFSVGDDGVFPITLRASFSATVTDNQQFQIQVVGIGATPNTSSSFALSNGGGAQTSVAGDNNRIEVTATNLLFTQNIVSPQLAAKNIGLQQSPVPVVKSVDALNNVDLDYGNTLSISSGVTMSTTTLTSDAPTPNAGVYTFPSTFQYLTTGSGTITATGPSLTFPSVVSTGVSVIGGTATVVDPAPGAPATISSLTNLSPGVPVFNFDITDDKVPVAATNNDGLPTLIQAITITANGSSNTVANWSAVLAGARLLDGGGHFLDASSITANTIVFTGIPNGSNTLGNVPDGGVQHYSLNVWLKSSLGALATTIDGQQFEFELLSTNVNPSPLLPLANSSFVSGGTANSGNNDVIDVLATQLRFIGIVPSASLNSAYPGPLATPNQVTVESVDANGNRDKTFDGAVSTVQALTNASSRVMTNLPPSVFTNGLLTFPSSFMFTTGLNGDPVALTIQAGAVGSCGTNYATGKLCVTSSAITLQSSFESQVRLDPAYSYSPKIQYVKYLASNIQPVDITNLNGSYEISRLILSDGDADGTAGDVDGANTILTSIRLRIADAADISTLSAIQSIALYNSGVAGATEISEHAVNGTDLTNGYVDFTGLNIIALDDNSPAPTTISVRVSFNSTSATIVDHESLILHVTGATLGGGSSFRANPGDIAGFAGGYQAPAGANAIDVVATKLDFTSLPGLPATIAGFNEPTNGGIVEARDQKSLLDLDFVGPLTLSSPVTTTGSFGFTAGVANLNGMLYTNTGDGTLTVLSSGLSSNAPTPVGGLPNISIPSPHIDVIHTTGAIATGNVITSTNLSGGSINKVIFGVTFSAPYTITGEPKLKSFVVSFSNAYSTVLLNPRVYESPTTSYFGATAVDVTSASGGSATVGNFTAPGTPYGLQVTWTPANARDLSTGQRTFFLMVDVDATASGSTPSIQPSVVDGGAGTLTNANITVTNGSSTASVTGQTYTFASIFPPILTGSNPARGQLNVDPNQATLDLTFSVPVWSLDQTVRLYDQTAGNTFVDLQAHLANGLYNPAAIASVNQATLISPIKFDLPGSLVADHVYYVTIAQGSQALRTGIMDENNNVFQGITYPGALYFKIASTAPPKLLGANTTPQALSDPSITFASPTQAVIDATFDVRGTAYYLLLPTGSPAPTLAQIDGTTAYAGYKAQGSFAITQTGTVSQYGIITPATNFVSNQKYDVWMYAKNDALPSGFATSAPYGPTPSFSTSVVGPTFVTLNVPSFSSLVTINNPTIRVCNNSYQIMNEPIIISEGTNTQFYTGGGSQSFNIVLPAGFQFDVSLNAVNDPAFGTIQTTGVDFIAPAPKLSFLGNSILKVTFNNSGNVPASASLDKIIISGLRVIASSSTSGAMFRLGGTAIPGIADSQTIGTLTSFDAPVIGFTNSYSIAQGAPINNVITSIPDNASPAIITLSPTTSLGAPLFGPLNTVNDYGPSSFSGQGVNINLLTLSAVTLDVPFNVTVTHTDDNGCISNNAIQYTVYDHDKALNITTALLPAGSTIVTVPKNSFCADNNNFIANQTTNRPTYGRAGHVRYLDFKGLAPFFQITADATIPPGVPTQIISGAAWQTLISTKLLTALTPTHPSGPDIFTDYSFDDAVIADAAFLSVGAIPDPYTNFRSTITSTATGATLTYYTGGSLGVVDITGHFQSRTNSAVKVPRVQRVTFYLPAVPIVDASAPSAVDISDAANPPNATLQNPGTLVYCEAGGLINITARPAAIPGTSTGTFTLKTVGGAAIAGIPVGAFTDNTNGSAVLDPALFTNGYADIRVEYQYQDVNSPCASFASQVIRITPNPVANFTTIAVLGSNVADNASFCVNNQVNFDAAGGANPSKITAAPGGTNPNTITSYAWNFGDIISGAAFNTSTAIAPSHTFIQPQPYIVSLDLTSNWGCHSVPYTTPTQTTVVGFKTQTLNVGGIPVVKFKMDGVSTNDTFHFNSNETSTPFGASAPFIPVGNNSADDTKINNGTPGPTIRSYDWDFGDGTSHTLVSGLSSDASFNNNVVTHYPYATPGTKQINLTVTSTLGCVNSLALQNSYRSIVVLPRIALPLQGVYSEDFEASNGNWQVWGTGRTVPEISSGAASATWAYGAPPASIATPAAPLITKGKIWKTNLSGNYNPGEKSALYSPSFDITNLTRPMLSFNSVTQMERSDGVVLEYSKDNLNIADPNKKWFTLGVIGDGEDWYTDQGIAGRPGTQSANDFGWSGSNITKWQSPKHILDEMYAGAAPSKAVFRVALGSAAPSVLVQGFALDNVRIGDRTRTILLESFVNTSDTNPQEAFQNDKVSKFISGSIGTEVVKINYHLGFPAKDPFNEDDPADPSSRALLYNIVTTPRSRLDGEGDDADRLFDNWVPSLYNLRTLQLAQADIGVVTNIQSDGSIRVMVNVTAQVLTGIPSKTILHVAFVEKSIALSSLTTAQKAMVQSGETTFDYVLKKMLPSAAGSPFGAILPFQAQRAFGPFIWTPDPKKLYPPVGDLAVAVFLQQEDFPFEVYQVEFIKDLTEPSVVTGLEPIAADEISVFPVPANKQMTVQLPGILKDDAPVLLMDQTGKTVYSSVIPGGASHKLINVEDLASGVYILQINVGNGNFTRKKVMVVREGN